MVEVVQPNWRFGWPLIGSDCINFPCVVCHGSSLLGWSCFGYGVDVQDHPHTCLCTWALYWTQKEKQRHEWSKNDSLGWKTKEPNLFYVILFLFFIFFLFYGHNGYGGYRSRMDIWGEDTQDVWDSYQIYLTKLRTESNATSFAFVLLGSMCISFLWGQGAWYMCLNLLYTAVDCHFIPYKRLVDSKYPRDYK